MTQHIAKLLKVLFRHYLCSGPSEAEPEAGIGAHVIYSESIFQEEPVKESRITKEIELSKDVVSGKI